MSYYFMGLNDLLQTHIFIVYFWHDYEVIDFIIGLYDLITPMEEILCQIIKVAFDISPNEMHQTLIDKNTLQFIKLCEYIIIYSCRFSE